MGFNSLKASAASRRHFFTTKFPDISGAHFIDLGGMKGWVDLEAAHWFWTRDSWIGIQCLYHQAIAP